MKLKRMDIFVIVFLLVSSLAMVFVTKNTKGLARGDYLLIQLDGKEYGRYDLSKDRTIEIKSKSAGLNTIEIKDKEAKMTFANCRDLICTKMPAIKDDGQTIVCLPHRLMVEVVSERESDIDQVVQ